MFRSKAFGITINRGIEIYAAVITTVTFEGLCSSCNNHPAEEIAPAAVIALPLYENERYFALFILGRLMDDHAAWAEEGLAEYKAMGKELMQAEIIKQLSNSIGDDTDEE